MYEDISGQMEDVCGILIMVKAVYDATGDIIQATLDEDYYFDVYMDALDALVNHISWGTVDDYDNVNKYTFPQMDAYYDLCRKYGRINKISFKNNPYVQKAHNRVAFEMDGIYSYCIDWSLYTPKKNVKKKCACLWVKTDPEFTCHVSLISALSGINIFYKEGVKEIKKAIADSKPNLKLVKWKNTVKKVA